MTAEIKELLKLFDGAMTINEIMNTDYSIINSIKMRYNEQRIKEAEDRIHQAPPDTLAAKYQAENSQGLGGLPPLPTV